jgi:hypothetical protein
MADPSDPPIFEAPRDVLAGGGRITQLDDRPGGRIADAELIATRQPTKVEPAQREVFADGAWIEVVTIGVDASNLLYAKQADRLLWSAVHRLLGALSITNQPACRDDGAINRSLWNTTRVRDIDAGDLTATPRGEPCDLSPPCGKVVNPTLLVPLRWRWRLTHSGDLTRRSSLAEEPVHRRRTVRLIARNRVGEPMWLVQDLLNELRDLPLMRERDAYTVARNVVPEPCPSGGDQWDAVIECPPHQCRPTPLVSAYVIREDDDRSISKLGMELCWMKSTLAQRNVLHRLHTLNHLGCIGSTFCSDLNGHAQPVNVKSL